jgi:hypothetical protein
MLCWDGNPGEFKFPVSSGATPRSPIPHTAVEPTQSSVFECFISLEGDIQPARHSLAERFNLNLHSSERCVCLAVLSYLLFEILGTAIFQCPNISSTPIMAIMCRRWVCLTRQSTMSTMLPGSLSNTQLHLRILRRGPPPQPQGIGPQIRPCWE